MELMNGQIRANRNVINHVKVVTELSKQVDILERESAVFRQEIERLQAQSNAKNALIQQEIYSLALLILGLNNQNNQNLDQIFMEDDNNAGIQQRQELSDFIRMLKFTYLMDPLVQPDEETLNFIIAQTPQWIHN